MSATARLRRPVAATGPDPAQPAAVLLLLLASGAMVAASLLEHGNLPYTRNFVTAEDYAVAAALFSVPVLGSAVLGIDPRHRSGWLMLGAGTAFSLALLCHALAVRLLVVAPHWHVVGESAAWLAMWLLVPGFGLLPFVMATWPDGRLESAWVRAAAGVAGVALGAVALAQALAPDGLDGTARRQIANPLGVARLRSVTALTTTAGGAVLGVFTLLVVADLLLRTARSGGERRRRMLPMACVALSVLGIGLGTAVVGGPAVLAGLLVGVGGIGVAALVASQAVRRSRRAERAREALVAEREDERRRLRRELHDGVGPLLAALRLELDDAPDAGAGDRARDLLDSALGEVRRIVRDLRPAQLDELGMAGALRAQVASLTAAAGLRLEVSAEEPPCPLPAAVEVALLRIAGEAVTNVVRHARATRCRVELRYDGSARLLVVDDGAGGAGDADGLGLPSMRARAEELGGTCVVRSGDNGGTVVEAVLPLGGGDG